MSESREIECEKSVIVNLLIKEKHHHHTAVFYIITISLKHYKNIYY